MSSTARAGNPEAKKVIAVARTKKRTFIALFLIPREELKRIFRSRDSEMTADSGAKLRACEDQVNRPNIVYLRVYSANLPLGFFVKIFLIRGQK